MTDLSLPRVPGGGAGKQVTLGGATDSSGNPAGNVVAELTSLSTTLGLYTPARDIYLDYFFGADDAYDTLTVASNAGLWLDIGVLNPQARQIVIQCEGTPSYGFSVNMSRNGLDADDYEVKANGGAGEVATQFHVIDSAAIYAYGYDQYIKILITPDAGQTGTQLNYIAYLTGRGG